MIRSPRKGQRVQAWYAAKWRRHTHLHGQTGTVVIVGKGKPRNHGVRIDGTLYVIHCGNLRPVAEDLGDGCAVGRALELFP